MMTRIAENSFWNSWGVLLGRIIIGGVFLMALAFKFLMFNMQVAETAQAGLPFPQVMVVLAIILELFLVFAFFTGLYFKEAVLLAIPYILVLAVFFHGPSHWSTNQDEFGFFIDHLTFIAGLLFMLAHGVGNAWRVKGRSAV